MPTLKTGSPRLRWQGLGATPAHLFCPETNTVGTVGRKGSAETSLAGAPVCGRWEDHTLLPANTLAKVSWRDLPVPNVNSTAAAAPETHPHGTPCTRTPPVSSSPGHAHAHQAAAAQSTHRISKSRSARKAPSSMQLMWLLSSCLWKSKGEREG